MKGKLFAAATSAALCCSVFPAAGAEPSQADTIKELQQRLEQALKMTDTLAKRVEQLEKASASAPKPSVDTAAQDAKIAEISSQVAQIATGMSNRGGAEGLPLHGFLDVGAANSNRDYPKGFNIGKLDFYLTPQFSDRVKGLAELNFEVSSAGEVNTDLERLQLGYTFSENLTGWMGRFHTPYGYFNTAFHHGAQIQTSVTRPVFLDFEDAGGILPAHTVGLWLTGTTKVAGGKWQYDAYMGNSPRIIIDNGTRGSLNPNLASTTNKKYMAGANVSYQFAGSMDGLRLGAHGFTGDVSDESDVRRTSSTRMLGGYAVFQNDDWEILSEYYRFRNRNKSTDNSSHTSWAAYAQAGRTFGLWTMFGRVEQTNLDQSDLYFAAQSSGQSYSKSVVGVRYDLDPKSAVKFEASRTRLKDREVDRFNQLWLQYAVRF